MPRSWLAAGKSVPHQYPGLKLPCRLRNLVFENKPESRSVSWEGSQKPDSAEKAMSVRVTLICSDAMRWSYCYPGPLVSARPAPSWSPTMNRSLLASPDPTGERERLVTGAGLWAHALTSLGSCFCLWFASILPWLWGQYLCPPQLPGTPCLKTVTSPRLCRLQSEPEKGSLSNKCWGLRSLLPDHLEQWFLNLMMLKSHFSASTL